MNNILKNGIQFNQIIWQNQELCNSNRYYGYSIESDFISVPTLYTDRPEILMIANTDCIIHGEIIVLKDNSKYEIYPHISIHYYNKNKIKIIEYRNMYSICHTTYQAGNIINEINIPSRFLKEIEDEDKIYYIQLIFVYDISTSLGTFDTYLI